MQETGRDVRGGALGGAGTLESLEDPAYRGLPDLGYSSRQTFRILFPLSCVPRAGSLPVTTLSSWTRTCTPGETWTWSWKVVDLGHKASWRRKRKEAAGERRAGSCLLYWLSLHRLYHRQLVQFSVLSLFLSQERPPSPGHALKMDSYLCPGQDHLTAPYLPDGTIDYTNMDY